MTNQEFSNSFTTLLNSYNTQAQFGEESSKADISLDEYEKSVLLTQAQDIVVKSYFNRNFNQQGEGFDDSSRRQVDFSSLIKVALLSPTNSNLLYDSRGVVFKMPRKIAHDGHVINGTTDVLFILNEKLIVERTLSAGVRGKWILKNYGDGTTEFTSTPNVEYHDLSLYYLIEGDNTPYYNFPGLPIQHAGNKEYWTIKNDMRGMQYFSYPSYTTFYGKQRYWTVDLICIDGKFKEFFIKPTITPHNGWNEYWTIDKDTNDPPNHYDIDPGDPTHYFKKPFWWINDDEDNTYEEEIDWEQIQAAEHYWIVNNSGHYESEPSLKDDEDQPRLISAMQWVVNGDTEHPLNSDPGDILETTPISDDWFIYYTSDIEGYDGSLDNLPEEKIIKHFGDKEPDIRINSEFEWYVYDINGEIIAGPFNQNIDENPVKSVISQYEGKVGYFYDAEERNKDNEHFKRYYIINKPKTIKVGNPGDENLLITDPTYPEYPDPEHPELAQGYYITDSNYGGMIGPFQYMPKIKFAENQVLRYFLINNDITNPYFEFIQGRKREYGKQWVVYIDDNIDSVYSSEIQRYLKNGTPKKYYFESAPNILYNEMPTIEPIDAVYKWIIVVEIGGVEEEIQFDYNGEDSEPVIQEVNQGSDIYIVKWVNAGDGHEAGEPIQGLEFTTEPVINLSTPTDEEARGYWVFEKEGLPEELLQAHFNEEPHAEHHPAQEKYWTVNDNPFMYDREPKVEEHEPSNPYFIINSDQERFDFQPVIIKHDANDSYWTYEGIDGRFNINIDIPPRITTITDPKSDAKFYTINSNSTRYYENGRPEFDVTDEVSPEKIVNEYVIVPISYREYDREMSKPYAQPLKKQAWRLFQNNSTGFDFDSELIPKFDVKQHILDPEQPGFNIGDIQLLYKIRYIRRPRPIILEDLPNGLEIDGETEESSCELNPIIHIDILNKAVELALATRAKSQPQQGEQRERER